MLSLSVLSLSLCSLSVCPLALSLSLPLAPSLHASVCLTMFDAVFADEEEEDQRGRGRRRDEEEEDQRGLGR
eukprot:COSAG03_NODE_674_length_6361_cov_5.994251_1_plen_71_part_10